MSIIPDKALVHETWLDDGPRPECPIQSLEVSTYRIPTASPEADGTLAWQETILVLVEVAAANRKGLGYTYADSATAVFIQEHFTRLLTGQDAMNVSRAAARMAHAIRNVGVEGVGAMALSAVDIALWDLKARVLDLPLVRLLGHVRQQVPAYGSGGFTSYTQDQLSRQLEGWSKAGLSRVKMKIGTDPRHDEQRVHMARRAVGANVELFVDANGAYHPRQALAVAERLANLGVVWFEEPVDRHDHVGMRRVRNAAPAGMDISGGEYGYTLSDFVSLLDEVDVLQADATRCGGFSGFLQVAALCDARWIPLSTHCAPSLHGHVGCAARPVCHLEYFFDHVRIEHMLFDGVPRLLDGHLAPDLSRPGLGLDFKRQDAARFTM